MAKRNDEARLTEQFRDIEHKRQQCERAEHELALHRLADDGGKAGEAH